MIFSLPASTLNITISQTSLSIAFGHTGRLNCSAVGGVDTLPLTLSWTTSANVSISTVVTTQLFVPMIANTLLLPTVNTSYRGVYTCTVNDAIRTVQSSVLVNVTGWLLCFLECIHMPNGHSPISYLPHCYCI